MRRFILLAVVFLFLLPGCDRTSQSAGAVKVVPKGSIPEDGGDAAVFSEAEAIVFAEHFFPDGLYDSEAPATLYYRMVSGKQGTTLVPYAGEQPVWSGLFQYSLEWQDEEQTVIRSEAFPSACLEPYEALHFSDYNGDGLLDFLLCDQGSRQPDCRVMTITRDGTVELLGEFRLRCLCPVGDGSPVFETNPQGNGFYVDYSSHFPGEIYYGEEVDLLYDTMGEYGISGAYLAFLREEYQWRDGRLLPASCTLEPNPALDADALYMEAYDAYRNKLDEKKQAEPPWGSACSLSFTPR